VPRLSTSLIALALFLTGTNYCLVGALGSHADGAMACHAAPRADSAPACGSHCDQTAPARSQAPAHTPPCCLVATAVAAPSAEKPITCDLDWAPLAITTPAEALPAPSVHRAAVFTDPSPPATPAALAPLASRAPPLS
jgi:hypothetical protein